MKIVDQRTGGEGAFEDLKKLEDLQKQANVEVEVSDWSLSVKGEPAELFKFLVAVGEPSEPYRLGADAVLESFSVSGDSVYWSFE